MNTNIKTLLNQVGAFFGKDELNKNQRATYDQLSRLTQRQLEDIGLTEGTILSVVTSGPESVRMVCPDGAVQTANNNQRQADVA
ncbi:MAG: DUF1127 domain-containing protein [Pseudomonadota bacterium]